MSAPKLSDAEKQEIIKIYQEVPEETTITLADRYGVSSSTIRRVLQSAISKEIYDTLTQQKQRLHRTGRRSPPESEHLELQQELPFKSIDKSIEPVQQTRSLDSTLPSSLELKRRRRRSSASDETDSLDALNSESALESDLEPSALEPIIPSNRRLNDVPGKKPGYAPVGQIVEHQIPDFINEAIDDEFNESFSEFDEEGDSIPVEEGFSALEFNGAFSEFDEDGDEDEDGYLEEDYEDEEDLQPIHTISPSRRALVQILPLSDAPLPKMCYLVTDRMGELVVRPLKAFGELGQIPPDEVQEKTLPVFDNHRVASRFSARNQRVLKVPSGGLLRKAAPYLQAKGITRLLIDGQVYRL
ncbi:MAG: transcriptional regulator [Microcoleaceae cyanobacterium]